MKKATELAEPVEQEIKVFEVIYYHNFRNDKWPIRIKFVNKKIVNDDHAYNIMNGFFEILEVSGNTEAAGHFQSSVMTCRDDRTILQEYLEKQVQEQLTKDI